MIKAKDIMTKDIVILHPNEDILQAARLLLEKGINGIPVMEEGKLVGIICQSDLIVLQKQFPLPSLFTLLDGFIPLKSTKHIEKTIQKMAAISVAEAMTANPVTVHPDTDIEKIASIMVDRNIHTIPVVDRGRLIGIIGKKDVLRTITSGIES